MSVGFVSAITPSSSNISQRSGSSPQSTKPRPLHAGEADRQDQIMYLLYDALWKKGEQAWIGISRTVKERLPCLYYEPAQNGKPEVVGEFIRKEVEGDQVEEDQVEEDEDEEDEDEEDEDEEDHVKEYQATLVDLTSLFNWTEEDAMLHFPTPVFLARDEYTELDKFLKSSSQHVLLLGQPGIGSCIYLFISSLDGIDPL